MDGHRSYEGRIVPDLEGGDSLTGTGPSLKPDATVERSDDHEHILTAGFSSPEHPHPTGRSADAADDVGVPVYVGAAANAVSEIRKLHCLGRVPGSALREHIARHGGSAANLHSGRWRIVSCTSLEEAIDFRAYLVQHLKPVLNTDRSSWNREHGVLYHRFVQELYASEAVGCDELEARFLGPGVYVFYHRDRAFWQSAAGESDEFRLLKRAIALSRVGDKRPARQILAHVISANPGNELAWLWYAYNLERNSDRIRVLVECLNHNPDCKEAKDRLIYLQTTEALRARVQEERGDISDRLAEAEARLGSLEAKQAREEQMAREAKAAYESARVRVEVTHRQIIQLKAELGQLREQLAEL